MSNEYDGEEVDAGVMLMTEENMREMLECARATQGKVKGAGFVPWFKMHPGGGKTQMCGKIANEWDFYFKSFIGATHTGPDFGLYAPNHETHELVWFTTGLLRGDIPEAKGRKGVMILIDEITTMPPDVQALFLTLLEDRTWDGQPVPDNVIYVVAGNFENTGCGDFELNRALKGRLCEIPCGGGWEQWCEWAIQNGVKPEIVAWHAFTSGRHLSVFDDKSDMHDVSRRDWVKISDVLLHGSLSASNKKIALSGYIGPVLASQYLKFEELTLTAQSAKQIISDPENATIYENQHDHTFAILNNLICYVKDAGPKLKVSDTDAIITYLERLASEGSEVYANLGFRMALQVNERFGISEMYQKFVANHLGLGQ